MTKKPIIEVKRYRGEGKTSWGVFRSDRSSPVCHGITRPHAEHIKILLEKRPLDRLPEKFPAAKNWFDLDDIVEVDERGYGIPDRPFLL